MKSIPPSSSATRATTATAFATTWRSEASNPSSRRDRTVRRQSNTIGKPTSGATSSSGASIASSNSGASPPDTRKPPELTFQCYASQQRNSGSKPSTRPSVEFEALDVGEKARAALRASAAAMAHRRILAPAESMNALTVGALHSDNIPTGPLPASTFDVWLDTGLCTVSSGLGPGISNAVKPDVLAPGGRHHVRLLPNGAVHLLRPIGKNSSLLGGILVAAPPAPPAYDPNTTGRSVGTSIAAAITTGVAARVHEALEAAYDDFLAIPDSQRAVLLKALLVHCARWTAARDLIIEVIGPTDNKFAVRQKDNVRRYLGYGAIDMGMVLDCATDRATLWAVGRLQRGSPTPFRCHCQPLCLAIHNSTSFQQRSRGLRPLV